MRPVPSDHSRLDERSLALHRRVAEKLLANPVLLETARANVRNWLQDSGSPKLALSEWKQILGGTPQEVAEFITQRSERARRLRQSSPFAGILTAAERRAIYESYSTRTHHPGGEPDRR